MKKFLCLIVLLCFLANLCACETNEGSGKNIDSTKPENTEATETEINDEESLEKVLQGLPDKDYNDYPFTILNRSRENVYWGTYDVYSDDINGEPINDAVYERNQKLEEKYNVKINEYQSTNLVSDFQRSINAGDNAYDVITDGLKSLSGLSTSGYLVDYSDIPNINLLNPWWDKTMANELSVMHHVFFATGDISVMDNQGTWCILFNKQLAENYHMGNLYEMVDNGTWTIDKMYDLAKVAAYDLNGDNKYTQEDQWGLLTENFNLYGFWAGGGNKIVNNNSEGSLELSMFNDRSVSMFEKALKLHLDESAFNNSQAPSYKDFTDIFTSGRSLFIYCSMLMITNFRASDVEFGILPAPKYDEAQEKYYNTYSNVNCTAYSVPISAPDLERTGSILEAMAAISKYTLTPAYYDVSLKGKFLRDNESKAMLDLILTNRSYDLGPIFDWGGLFTIFNGNVNSSSFNFASAYDAVETKAQVEIDNYLNLMKDLY